jgi:hypothetical protein
MPDFAFPMMVLELVPVIPTAGVVALLGLMGRRRRIQLHRPDVWTHMHLTPPGAPGDTAPAPDRS